ncbi:hypothetical protein PoB_003881700 [Plakobranchus ocellatus]|uniref:Uncharacterized protein n=1 Tax=Plakobranchus ocellatus TaxID=259542 RepID=A0AAV4AZ56_9GAST|nr:hypothetical protein PoB_003881700 [Plakobranchus ocellatus]
MLLPELPDTCTECAAAARADDPEVRRKSANVSTRTYANKLSRSKKWKSRKRMATPGELGIPNCVPGTSRFSLRGGKCIRERSLRPRQRSSEVKQATVCSFVERRNPSVCQAKAFPTELSADV